MRRLSVGKCRCAGEWWSAKKGMIAGRMTLENDVVGEGFREQEL